MDLAAARADVTTIFDEVLRAVDPEKLVRQSVKLVRDRLLIDDQQVELSAGGNVVLLGVGKSAVGMARGVEAVLGDRLDHGLVVTKRGLGLKGAALARTTIIESSHPIPDESSVAAAEELLRQAQSLGEGDLAIVVVSGGGSALVEAPNAEISLEDFKVTTSLLLGNGTDISTLNAVRRRLSRIKAGGLARTIAPARVINLILSDVLGNSLNAIASGLSIATDSNDVRYVRALRQSPVWEKLPANVRARLERGPATNEIVGSNVIRSIIVGDAATAARAAGEAANRLGYASYLLGTEFTGDARGFGRFWGQLAVSSRMGRSTINPQSCILGTGEMTVIVQGNGSGGRNTEMAASAAFEIAGCDGIAVASLATDGDDGTSGAAGGVVVGDTIRELTAKGLDAESILKKNDTRRFLDESGGLIITGQTGTNVNDLYLTLIN